VLDTRTWPGPAFDITRAPMWTAIPPTFGPMDLDLTHVDAGPDLDTEPPHAGDGGLGAPDRLGGLIEGREEPVPRRVHLSAVEAFELPTDQRVMSADEPSPLLVTNLGGPLGRAHDVGEQDGGEETLRGRRLARHGGSLGHRNPLDKGFATSDRTAWVRRPWFSERCASA